MDRRAFVLAAAGVLTGGGVAHAAEEEPIAIELDEDPSFPNGKVLQFSGFSDEKGPVLALKGLSIFQPVRVALVADDRADTFHLKIAHPGSKDMIFDKSTDVSTGSTTARFRAQGDILIAIASPAGRKRFTMIVWAGDALAPKMKSVLRPIP